MEGRSKVLQHLYREDLRHVVNTLDKHFFFFSGGRVNPHGYKILWGWADFTKCENCQCLLSQSLKDEYQLLTGLW